MWRHRKKKKDMMKANRKQRKENKDGFAGIDLGRVHKDKKWSANDENVTN
jgi:hypothetical protein